MNIAVTLCPVRPRFYIFLTVYILPLSCLQLALSTGSMGINRSLADLDRMTALNKVPTGDIPGFSASARRADDIGAPSTGKAKEKTSKKKPRKS